MKVIVKNVNCKQEVREISDGLRASQEIVDGYIEVVPLEKNVIMVCNEEGKINGLEPNLLFPNDVIVGNVFFCSDTNYGAFDSLSEDQMKYVTDLVERTQLLRGVK